MKILIIEDNPNDVELLQYELKKAGVKYEMRIVQTKESYEDELNHFEPEIVLSDYSLPSFDGVSAFQIMRKVLPGVPFIFVSGTIGEENAVELIKEGVTDYVLKEKMYQVAPKIFRALKERDEQKKKIISGQELKKTREQLQKIMDLSLDVICTVDVDGKFIKVGAASKRVWEYSPQELVGTRLIDLVHKDDKGYTEKVIADIIGGMEMPHMENRCIRKDGVAISVFWSARWDATEKIMYCIARDASEIKEAESKIRSNEVIMKKAQEIAHFGSWHFDINTYLTVFSDEACRILGVKPGEMEPSLDAYLTFIHPDDLDFVKKKIAAAHLTRQGDAYYHRIIRRDGITRYIYSESKYEISADGDQPLVYGVIHDVTEQKIVQEQLRISEEKYRTIFQSSPLPMWIYDMESYHFLDVNDAAIRHYGYSREEFLAMTVKDIRPKDDIKEFEKLLDYVKETGFFNQGIFRHVKKSGEVIHVEVQGNLIYLDKKRLRLIHATDISERINYVQAIEERNKKLIEIAWIQSHVIRAPLARIMGLVNILKDHSSGGKDNVELLGHLTAAANELDGTIRSVVSRTEEIEIDSNKDSKGKNR